jgi:hypothetical protein
VSALFRDAATFAIAMASVSPALAQSGQAPITAPVDQVGHLTGQRLQVEAGAAGDTASLSFQLPFRDTLSADLRPDLRRFTNDSLSLIVSTPWSGKADAEPASLNGLANGTSLTLRWSRFVSYTRGSAPVPEGVRAIERRAEAACRSDVDESHEARRDHLRLPETGGTPEQVAQRRVLEVQRDLERYECLHPPGSHLNLVAEHLEDSIGAYVSSQIPVAPHEMGFEASVGRNGFEFIDPATLANLTDTRVQWSARAYYSQYFLQTRTAFTLSASYERAYKAAKEATFCPPNPNNVVVRCTTAAGGPPVLNESLLLSAGLRHQFQSGALNGFAISPLLTYDVLDDAVGVDLPIYFIPNSDGGLSGGVRFGYRSDRDDEFTAGIFIGAAFNILQ